MNVFEIIMRFRNELISGLGTTLKLSFIVFPLSIILGVLLALIRHNTPKYIGKLIRMLSIIISSVPLMVFLFWMHYPFQMLFGIVIDPFYTSVLVLTLFTSFLISEYIFNSLDTFPKELIDTVIVSGLSRKQITTKVQLPIIARQIIPNLILSFNFVLQSTLFCSFISVEELFMKVQQINAEVYKPVEIYTSIAVFFIAICLSINLIAFYFKRKFAFDLNQY